MTSGIKLTIEEATKYFDNTGLELLEFRGSRNPVKVKCYCGNSFETNLYSIKNKLTTSCGCKGRGGSNFKNLSGSKIYKWNIDSLCEDTIGSGKLYYNCTCDCGNIKRVSAQNLQSGKTKSCGCNRKGIGLIDITGYTVGKLTVINLSKEQNYNDYYWDCICECGRITSVSGIHLRAGNTRSCGHCGNFKNGKLCSFRQELIYENIREFFPTLSVELNYKIINGSRPKYADIYIKDHNIIIEYDEWFWHGDKTIKDNDRNQYYITHGYKLLVIQAADNLPRKPQLKKDIQDLIDGKINFKIRKLPKWGEGPIFQNRS